jgi:hypothetical protein
VTTGAIDEEPAVCGIAIEELAERVIPRSVPFTADELAAWLTTQGFVVVDGTLLRPTTAAVELIGGLG